MRINKIFLPFFLTLLPTLLYSQDYYKHIYEAESRARNGKYNEAITEYQKASAVSELKAEDAFNLSCLYSRQKDSVGAIKYLGLAQSRGFGNADWMEALPELAYVRSLSAWKALVAKAREIDQQLSEKIDQKQRSDNYNVSRIFTPGELHEDIALLRKALEEAHPGLYEYTEKKLFDKAWEELLNKTTESQTVLSFYYQLWKTVNLIRDVHSETTLPPLVNQQFLSMGHFFPVPLKFIDHRCYVNLKPGSGLPLQFGDEILAIDGHAVAEIEKKLHELIVADGYSVTGKQRLINRLFYKLYTLAYQPGDSIAIEYRKYGMAGIFNLRMNARNKKAVDAVYALKYPELNDSVAARFYQVEKIPVLKINSFSAQSFSNSKINYYQFLDSVFTRIHRSGTNKLIIDLRQNNGGDEEYLQTLLSYLLDKPWKPYKSAHVVAKDFSFLPFTDDSITHTTDRIKVEFQPDNTGRLVRKDDWAQVAPLQTNRFNGQLVVLIGGLDVSAGSTFPAILYQNRVNTTFVGEETGGGFYRNNSSYYFRVTLPNTKIQFKVPLVQLKMNVAGMPYGHGLIPQYKIQESMADLIDGRDPALDKAMSLLKNSESAK